MKNRFLAILVALIVLAVAAPVFAGPVSVSMVPNALNVAPGSTVNVSINMVVESPFTMTAMSEIIFYDPAVFTYVDPSVVQGAFLSGTWDFSAAASVPGQLRVGAMIWSLPFSETLAPGTGTLFTFTLLANATAPLGPSALSWGNGSFLGDGFGYGDEDWVDVLVPSTGTSINVGTVPDPGSSLLLLGIGLVGLVGAARRRLRK